MAEDLTQLSAAEAARRIHKGELASVALVQACLDQIAKTDDGISAWAYVGFDLAMDRARAADRARSRGLAIGPLHGVPVGVKDIIDTAEMPTENGTVLDRGRQPTADAFVISWLRAAGAILLGKTVTTELAVYSPNQTRNPHNPNHTPGGSSSGSAAAVAAFQVPVTVGTQTNGSVLRPASFCGVVGFKPSYGAIPRAGVLKQSQSYDQIGTFGRSVEDAALLAAALFGYDKNDPASRPSASPDLVRILGEAPPMPPRLAFVKTAFWDRAEPSTREAFNDLVAVLGDRVTEVILPGPFADLVRHHWRSMVAEIAANFATFEARGRDQLSPRLQEIIDEGKTVTALEYIRALDWRTVMIAGLAEIFDEFDAILCPSAVGEAPLGLESTGDPIFCTMASYTGTPSVSLPLLTGPNDLPLGVQLVGARGDDARLLRTARWLAATVAGFSDQDAAA